MEGGKPVDASAKILQSQDLDGTFNGVVELSKKWPAATTAGTCLPPNGFGMRSDVPKTQETQPPSKLRSTRSRPPETCVS